LRIFVFLRVPWLLLLDLALDDPLPHAALNVFWLLIAIIVFVMVVKPLS
jgi:hypothetical protein